MSSPYDPHLTYDEAGDLLGSGPGPPRRLVAEGRLDAVRRGRGVRIPQSALLTYLTTAQDRAGPSRDSAASTNDAA